MAIEALDDWTPEKISAFRSAITERGAGLMMGESLGAIRAIERRDERITLLREMLDRANAIIGEQADEAKRLSDALFTASEKLDKCREPCPNHPNVIGLPFEACPVCVNST